jgi:hypothetical protein
MSLVIVETVVEQPITDTALEEMDQIALPCLQARGVTWLHSLLSSDRLQMICFFDAPDAASVRDAYAKLGVQKRAIWAGEIIQPDGIPSQLELAERYVIESVLSETDWNEAQQKFSQSCAKDSVNWLRSYLSLDRTRVISEFKALDAETLRNIQHQVGISEDGIWAAQLLMP